MIGFMKKAMPLMALVAVATASASLTYLPDSSYSTGGTSYFNTTIEGKVVKGRVEFKVYDTVANPNELVGTGGYAISGEGRYVYAYQLFNTGSSTIVDAVPYFALSGIGTDAVKSNDSLGTAKSTDADVDATDISISADKSKVTFVYEGDILAVGKNSYIMFIRSDNTPKIGSYALTAPSSSDIIVPDGSSGNEVPEPATMALLLAGSFAALKRRK